MQEKIEWEIVDEARPNASRSNTHGATPSQPNLQQLLQAFLGRWWRWKIFGMLTFASVMLVAVVTLTGVFAVILAVAATMAIAIGKLRQWARSRNRAVST